MTTIATAQRTAAARPYGLRAWVRRHPIIAFFALAYLYTWGLLLPFALDRNPEGLGLLPVELPAEAFFLAFILATFGPMLAGVLVSAALDGKAGVRELLGRIVRWRVGLRWYAAALASFLMVFLGAYSLVYRGAPLVSLGLQWPLLLTVFLPGALVQMILPGLGEETGWRGFALPRMQAAAGPVAASLVLGALHGLWHLPVLFTPLLGPFTPGGLAAFVLTAMGGTFIYTWIFNRSRGSVLIAMLIHGASNSASGLITELIPEAATLPGWAAALGPAWINVLAFGAVTLVLLAATRGRLGYRPEAAGA
jgi:uncharacterized protein